MQRTWPSGVPIAERTSYPPPLAFGASFDSGFGLAAGRDTPILNSKNPNPFRDRSITLMVTPPFPSVASTAIAFPTLKGPRRAGHGHGRASPAKPRQLRHWRYRKNTAAVSGSHNTQVDVSTSERRH
ncbi:MAG: hypothetical protein WB341_03930 [Terracidiphilus sp.]